MRLLRGRPLSDTMRNPGEIGRPRIGVVVSTYRRPDALEAVLGSLDAQTYRAFEVIVADDGSGPETRECVEAAAERLGYPLRYVWQEDRGYRLAAIRNRAAAALTTEYLVFIDGDCLARPDFLDRHARLAETGRFVHGSRVRLGRELTAEVLSEDAPAHLWSTSRWLLARARGRVDRLTPLVRLPLGPLRRATPRKWRGVKGCNLAMWREDLLAVNGFDESFEGWGYEDNDLVVRLMRSGVTRKEGRFAVPVLHLWHDERAPETRNRELLDARLRSGIIRAERGIARYLQETAGESRVAERP